MRAPHHPSRNQIVLAKIDASLMDIYSSEDVSEWVDELDEYDRECLITMMRHAYINGYLDKAREDDEDK